MKYKEFKEKKAEEDQAFKRINSILTFIAYILRYRFKEFLIVLVIILASMVLLQWMGFDFKFWK